MPLDPLPSYFTSFRIELINPLNMLYFIFRNRTIFFGENCIKTLHIDNLYISACHLYINLD